MQGVVYTDTLVATSYVDPLKWKVVKGVAIAVNTCGDCGHAHTVAS